jgi:hypothetical protein
MTSRRFPFSLKDVAGTPDLGCSIMTSHLVRLQAWYARQCDGEWEHNHGVTVQSCDNPGWLVKVDLNGTSLAEQPFIRVAENVDAEGWQRSEQWLDCHIAEDVWSGAGDENKLERIVEIFLSWAESTGSPEVTAEEGAGLPAPQE